MYIQECVKPIKESSQNEIKSCCILRIFYSSREFFTFKIAAAVEDLTPRL